MTPRAMIKALVRGEVPPRLLLMPVLFSLGARLENLPLEAFQKNPTKIVNALRQIRNVFKVDGLTCYFDPDLELDALGFRCEQRASELSSEAVPFFSNVDDLRQSLNPVEFMAGKGRVPVACEVLRRIKAMLNDEPALLIRVAGPVSLAKQLFRGAGKVVDRSDSIPLELLEFAAATTLAVAQSFAAAGADVILLAEDFGPDAFTGASERYSSWLAPVVNTIRFYEALPVLLLGSASQEMITGLVAALPECILCPTLISGAATCGLFSALKVKAAGCALPVEAFVGGSENFEQPLSAADDAGCCIVTSAEDIRATVDVKLLGERLRNLRERLHKSRT